MAQRVFICGCGWRGTAVMGGPLRVGVPPTCPTCGTVPDTVESQRHPRVTRVCVVCRQPFLGGRQAQACPEHVFDHRRSRVKAAHGGQDGRKYRWTPALDALLRKYYDGKVKHRAAMIAAKLGWPAWVIKKRASALGLTHPAERRDYTADEVAFILEWTGRRDSTWIARRLHRTLTSVVLKQKRMRISRRVTDAGYTLHQLSEAFGVDHHVVAGWVRQGKLQAQKRGTQRHADQGGDIWCVSDEAVLRFVTHHPLAFRLDKVDQTWFMDLITTGGTVDRAMAAATLRASA